MNIFSGRSVQHSEQCNVCLYFRTMGAQVRHTARLLGPAEALHFFFRRSSTLNLSSVSCLSHLRHLMCFCIVSAQVRHTARLLLPAEILRCFFRHFTRLSVSNLSSVSILLQASHLMSFTRCIWSTPALLFLALQITMFPWACAGILALGAMPVETGV